MSILTTYKNQVELLLDVLPFIQNDPRFALKGGTAINLFHRDMPRLSVDIDLTYLPIESRDIFLANLTQAMQAFAGTMTANGLHVETKYSGPHIIKLLVSNHQATIKIEPNTVLRGSVFEPEIKELVEAAQAIFLQTQKVKTVSMADLYAGKICAALDRQHPRDLFDIKLLFENEGITTSIRQAFVVYLASSPRPMSELLSPHELDIKDVFHQEFIGMTEVRVDYEELCAVRKQLINTIQESLLLNEKDFLISIKSGEPQWDLIPIPKVSELPGLRWKMLNIKKMDKKSKLTALHKLKEILDR
ncbi:MAG: nucleotidyl transferase AbiEii/AbiGii toxin family protein [Gammaproteobacteria bacterium]